MVRKVLKSWERRVVVFVVISVGLGRRVHSCACCPLFLLGQGVTIIIIIKEPGLLAMVDPQLHDDLALNTVQEETEHFKDKNSKDLTTSQHAKKYEEEEEEEMVDLLSSSVLPSLPATSRGIRLTMSLLKSCNNQFMASPLKWIRCG